MKKLAVRLYRALMFLLALLPVSAAVYGALMEDYWRGLIWMAVQTAVAALFTLVPAFVGNYREYEVVQVEKRSASLDPDPDRETRRELVREGHRFPLRLSADIVLLALNLVLLTLVDSALFGGSMMKKAIFMAAQSLLMMLAMNNLATAQCFWLDIPGILVGALGYLGMAIYLYAGEPLPSLRILITAAAVVYLFVGGVSLNRQSIALSMASHTGDTPRAPRQIASRNRRIVLGFASLVTVVSLISPIRTAVLWLIDRLGDAARFLLRLIGFGNGQPAPDMPLDAMGMMMDVPTVEIADFAEEASESYLLVYVFFAFVGLCFLWIGFDLIRKLVKKLSKWMEKFASGVNEGFYDEREELMTADEMRQHLKNSMKNRLQALLSREPKWEELSGRERVRRLMRDFYKKRAYRIKGLRTMTAREAIAAVDKEDKARLGEMYDRARYSSHDVSADEADRLKKELKL